MFGNSYTSFLFQINGEDAGLHIWQDIETVPFVKELERSYSITGLYIGTRICYSDLTFIVLQGESQTIENNRKPFLDMINTKYSQLISKRMLCIEVCPNNAKNTFTKGKVCDETVESIECMRLALVFHGYADLLPFLTLLNSTQNFYVNQPRMSPRQLSPINPALAQSTYSSDDPHNSPIGNPLLDPRSSPIGSPIGNSVGNSANSPIGNAMGNTNGNPMGNTMGSSNVNPMGNPNGNPNINPMGNPNGNPNGNPMGNPNGNPIGNPNGNPIGNPNGNPNVNPMGNLNVNPMGNPNISPRPTLPQRSPINQIPPYSTSIPQSIPPQSTIPPNAYPRGSPRPAMPSQSLEMARPPRYPPSNSPRQMPPRCVYPLRPRPEPRPRPGFTPRSRPILRPRPGPGPELGIASRPRPRPGQGQGYIPRPGPVPMNHGYISRGIPPQPNYVRNARPPENLPPPPH